jgi:hypothetical protein
MIWNNNCYSLKKESSGFLVLMGTQIEKAALKKRMLAACIAKQQSVIRDFRKRLEALLITEGLGSDDSYESSDRSGMSASSLTEHLRFAEDEMKQLAFLQLLEEQTTSRIEPGAAVVTNAGTFYISVSIEQFKVDDESFIGLSVHSPLFIAMKGKVVGETITYRGRDYYISEIF